VARMQLGDHDGIDDLIRGMAAAKAQGLLFERAIIQWDYVANLMDLAGAEDALEACMHALDEARRTGAQLWALAFRAGLIQRQYFTGDWDEALGEADGLQTTLLEAEDSLDLMVMQGPRAAMLAAKGQPEEAIEAVEWLLEQGRAAEMSWLAAYALVAAAAVRFGLGQPEAVRELLGELATHDVIDYTEFVPAVVRMAVAVGSIELARQITRDNTPLSPLREHEQVTCRALLAEQNRDHEAAAAGFADAAARWHEFGVPYEEAQALLGQGRCLAALGRAPEAAPVLEQGREIFERLGAKPALAETDELMQQVASA